MRVKTNSLYMYNANGWDTFIPCKGNTLAHGQIVRVINLPMAPKANTMGQCYVAHPKTRQFICMVSTGSLEALPEYCRRDLVKFVNNKKTLDGPIVFRKTETGYEWEVVQS